MQMSPDAPKWPLRSDHSITDWQLFECHRSTSLVNVLIHEHHLFVRNVSPLTFACDVVVLNRVTIYRLARCYRYDLYLVS